MRLRQFRVQGLFGIFNHAVPLNLEQRITILHAPNGYGKTVILRFLSGFFGGSLKVFRSIEFRLIEFEFDDGHTIAIQRGNPKEPKGKADEPPFTISDSVNGVLVHTWDGWHLDRRDSRR